MCIWWVMGVLSRGLLVVFLTSVLAVSSGCWRLRPGGRVLTPYVAATTVGTLRDDYKGWIGMKVTTGVSQIAVTALGRFVAPGNRETHTVKIVSAEGGKDIASVSVSLAGAAAGRFKYADLPAPVTLAPGASYYIVTSETFDSDQWYHSDTQILTTDAATCDSAVYWSNINEEWTTEATKNHTFGPVGFLY